MNITPATPPKRSQIPVLIQFPNASLIIALVASLAGYFLSGEARGFTSAVYYAALTIWAYAEITQGINYFRRILGLVVLIYIVVDLTKVLPR